MSTRFFKRGQYAVLKGRPVKIIDTNMSKSLVEFRYLDDPSSYTFQTNTANLEEINQDTAKVLYGNFKSKAS